MAMTLMQADMAEITAMVKEMIPSFLDEKMRRRLINLALSTYADSQGDFDKAKEIVEWELRLIPQMKQLRDQRTHSEIIGTGKHKARFDRTIVAPKDRKIRLPEFIPMPLRAWLNEQALPIYRDADGAFISCPRQYDSAALRKKIKEFLDNAK